MLVNCKVGCIGKRSTTTASLSLEDNKVYCDFCHDEILVSPITKNIMKQSGHVIKPHQKAFQFKCETCKKSLETELTSNDLLKGVGCDKNCKFSVSKFFILGMKNIKNLKTESKEDDDK